MIGNKAIISFQRRTFRAEHSEREAIILCNASVVVYNVFRQLYSREPTDCRVRNNNTHTVTFNSNGGSAVSSQTVNDNSTATQPADPTKTGYTLGGWYSDSGLTTAFDFTTPITADTTLYAKWNRDSDMDFSWTPNVLRNPGDRREFCRFSQRNDRSVQYDGKHGGLSDSD